MKKKMIVTGITAIALVAALQTSSVFAAVPAKETPSSVVTTAPVKVKSFNDSNDTVCNYCGKDCSFVDEDGDGVCDNYKQRSINRANAGKGYVDEDGDGVCDNYASRSLNKACGWGGAHKHDGHAHGGGSHRR